MTHYDRMKTTDGILVGVPTGADEWGSMVIPAVEVGGVIVPLVEYLQEMEDRIVNRIVDELTRPQR